MIELKRIYGILSSFLGESKQGGYIDGVTQYQFNCPYCADEKGAVDGKYNLEVSLQIMKFHCWVDSIAGSLSKLIKRWGGRQCLKEYFEIINELRSSKLYELEETIDIKSEEPQISLPKTFKKINLKTCSDKRLRAFLKKRCFDQWTINKFNIGATTWDEEDKSWANRVIIPSYNEYGQLNYFVGRDFLPEKKEDDKKKFFRPKYKNCDADKKEIVFQESLIDWDSDIYLCEGAIDCLMVPNGLSLLGKSLKKDSETYSALHKNANANIIICLDADTKIEETMEIYRTLNVGRLQGKIRYIRLGETGIDGKDFSDIFEKFGIGGIAKTLRAAKTFTEQELLF